MRDGTVKRLSQLHTMIYRVTGGVVGRRLVDNDMLLLTTRGRVTGRPHTVPLLYLGNGNGLVVIGSYGGRDHHPEWYRNLLADPEATVQIRSASFPVTSRTMSGDERAAWWGRVTAAYDGYAAYASRTDREIPIIALTPVA